MEVHQRLQTLKTELIEEVATHLHTFEERFWLPQERQIDEALSRIVMQKKLLKERLTRCENMEKRLLDQQAQVRLERDAVARELKARAFGDTDSTSKRSLMETYSACLSRQLQVEMRCMAAQPAAAAGRLSD
jgi:hypothetical protein